MAKTQTCAFRITDQQAKDYMSFGESGALVYAQKLARDEGIATHIKCSQLIDCGRFYRLSVEY